MGNRKDMIKYTKLNSQIKSKNNKTKSLAEREKEIQFQQLNIKKLFPLFFLKKIVAKVIKNLN